MKSRVNGGIIRLRAKAYVTLTVEVECKGPWGADCTIAQVYEQAEDEAKNILNSFESKDGLNGVKAVGKMGIKTVIVEEHIP